MKVAMITLENTVRHTQKTWHWTPCVGVIDCCVWIAILDCHDSHIVRHYSVMNEMILLFWFRMIRQRSGSMEKQRMDSFENPKISRLNWRKLFSLQQTENSVLVVSVFGRFEFGNSNKGQLECEWLRLQSLVKVISMKRQTREITESVTIRIALRAANHFRCWSSRLQQIFQLIFSVTIFSSLLRVFWRRKNTIYCQFSQLLVSLDFLYINQST